MFHPANNPFSALEQYASTYAKAGQVKLNPIINGWCSWFYTYRDISEDEVVRNAEFVAKHLKRYGMNVVQIDDGFYRMFGDWEGNERFPHGMKWLADRIRSLDLVAGLWLGPYVIDKRTEVAQKHPDYLVHGLDGELHPIGHGGDNYALDITHPGGREWLRNLFDTVANQWGYDFLKIDFVEWSLLAAPRYHDASVSRAQAYRMGFQTMREAIGPKRHLLDCGPAQNTVGILDSVRIELDQAELNWDQYTSHFYANAPAAAKRYYFNGRTWINDDDQLGLAWMTLVQAQAAATIIAMSGGTLISGDRLVDLDPARLEILKKVVPAHGVAARPLDLFQHDFPRVFSLPIQSAAGDSLLVAVFNYDREAAISETLEFASLGLDPAKPYVAFEFWTQELIGELRGRLDLNVNPSSVQLVSVREALPHPQVVGTSRHFTQGPLEIKSQTWAEPELKGVLKAQAGTVNEIFIRMPPGWKYRNGYPGYVIDGPGYTAKTLRNGVLRLLFTFEETGDREFSVKFEKAAPEAQEA
jgi:alpha-galactosidase